MDWLYYHFPMTTFIIYNTEKKEVLKLWVIFHCKWFSIHLHRIITADTPECYHSHPATAWRFILWGGYTEENVNIDTTPWKRSFKRWWPLMGGRVERLHVHRIHAVKHSWSLWFRSNIMTSIYLFGNGWVEDDTLNTVIREIITGEDPCAKSH